MRYLLITLIITATMAQAETAQQMKERIAGLPGVKSCGWTLGGEPKTLGNQSLHRGQLEWYTLDAHNVFQKWQGEVGVINFNSSDPEKPEAAYWMFTIPEIDRPAPVVEKFITGRTGGGFTKAEVEAFCNAQWRATSGNSAALDIKEFTVSNVDSHTVKVSGLFHTVTGNTRNRHTFLIALVDANGAATGANVKFEKVLE